LYEFINDIKEFSEDTQIKLEKLYYLSIFKYSEDIYSDKISGIINEIGFYGDFHTKSEKERFFNTILDKLYYKLDKVINGNNIEYVMMLLRLLEYNRYLANNLMIWSRNKDDDFIITIKKVNDLFSKTMLQFLEKNKNQNDNPYIFKSLENTIALCQGGIETIIERVYYQYTKGRLEENYRLTNIEEKKFNEIFDFCFLFQIVNSLKIQFTIGELAKSDLIVNQEEGINYIMGESYRKDPCSEYFDYIINKEEFTRNDINSNNYINNLIKKYYGLRLDEMLKVLSCCKREELTETFVADKQGLINFIYSKTGICIEDIELFINNMIFNLDENNFIIDSSNRCNKVSRKCLLDICNLFIFPYNLFHIAVSNIYMDLVAGDSCYSDLEKKLRIFSQKRNNEFELAVYKKLIAIPNALVKHNVHNICDENGKRIIPNQIDIILLFNNIIYIIECKDMPLKITPRKISNTENKFKKEYNGKLKGKIKEIDINKRAILHYMGDNHEGYINSEVKGIIVTSEFFDPSKDIVKYPTIVWTHLVEYLNEISKQESMSSLKL